ncbi:MAG: formyltransferase family protein [Candidatus Paceibacterota bacterium]|jgi:hypothetical protein
MSIVVITTKEESKRQYVNSLHKMTSNGVALVLFVKPKKTSISKRIIGMYDRMTLSEFLIEVWYTFLLRYSKQVRNALTYFKISTLKETSSTEWIPKTIEVEDINSNTVKQILDKISPRLIVLWNSPIIKPHILQTAGQVINLHMGLCPHYKGSVANQFALLEGGKENVGATIHYVDSTLDGGDIIAIIKPDITLPPRTFFCELNDKTQKCFLETAVRLFSGDRLVGTPQGLSTGKNYMLKHWTPKARYKTGKKILSWERSQN